MPNSIAALASGSSRGLKGKTATEDGTLLDGTEH